MTPDPSQKDLEAFRGPLTDRTAEFLKAEYEHLGGAFLSNEETGERRVDVLIGLIAAVTAGIGFAAESLASSATVLVGVVATAAFVLLLFGLGTLRRIMERNVTTSEYLDALRRIRARWAWNEPELVRVMAFVPKQGEIRRKRVSLFKLDKAGLLETVAILNGLLAAIGTGCLAWLLGYPSRNTSLLFGAGFVALLAAWVLQMLWTSRLYGVLGTERRKRRSTALEFWAEQGQIGGEENAHERQ